MGYIRYVWGALLLCLASVTGAQDIAPGRNYELRTLGGLVLDNQESMDSGSRLFVAKPVPGREAQVWQFQPVEGQEDVYLLVSPLSMHAIDNGGNGRAGDNVIQWSSDRNNPNQYWQAQRQSDGTYVFTSVASGFCLSYGEKGIPGEPVVQQALDAASYSRQWRLVPSNVQVTGIAEEYVTPDEIYISVTIRDVNNKTSKKSLEQQQTEMVKALTSMGIDTKNITVSDMASNLQEYILLYMR